MSEEQFEDGEEYQFEFLSHSDYIQAAYFALSSVDDVDVEIVSDIMRKRIFRIKRKSIKIIDYCLGELYNELFDDDLDG